jgi:hypothetical protein
MDLGRIIMWLVVAWIVIWALNHGMEVSNFVHSFVNSAK